MKLVLFVDQNRARQDQPGPQRCADDHSADRAASSVDAIRHIFIRLGSLEHRFMRRPHLSSAQMNRGGAKRPICDGAHSARIRGQQGRVDIPSVNSGLLSVLMETPG